MSFSTLMEINALVVGLANEVFLRFVKETFGAAKFEFEH